jgi:hypothetical protein
MLGGAREFRYDWILLRARNLPHEAGGAPAPIILRGGKRLAVRPARLSAARSSECRNDRRFPPPWSVEEQDALLHGPVNKVDKLRRCGSCVVIHTDTAPNPY